MATIGVLHPGEMGAAVGGELVRAGHTVLWAGAGRSEATAGRAEAKGLTDSGDLSTLVARSELVLSVCPPAAAEEVAAEAAQAGFSGLYLDANAVSPTTAAGIRERVAGRGATYVDGGIIGPPPGPGTSTRLYLSGPEAPRVAALFAGTAVDARDLGPEPTAASALKMAYAAWTKGTAALLVALRATAEHHGVAAALAAEWAGSQPDLAARADRADASARAKGWRWVGEMEEIARTFDAAGQPEGFHEAAAEVFRRFPRSEGGA